jgi:heme/copper-type cytochrome/quinol oxidase subunit 3
MKNKFLLQDHPYNIVSRSPWPLTVALGIFFLALNGLLYLQTFKFALFGLIISFLVIFYSILRWTTDVIYENKYLGEHTTYVEINYLLGFILFLLSEILFFISFFWASFNYSFNPTIWIGCVWPPEEISKDIISHKSKPSFMNVLLLLSSFTITCAHQFYSACLTYLSVVYWFITILLGIIFFMFQISEYRESYLSFSSSVFGSVFFILTGFHGLHVLLGLIWLSFSFFELHAFYIYGTYLDLPPFFRLTTLTGSQFKGPLFSIYYWHFVDTIWLFVFYLVYVSISLENINFLWLIGTY